MIIVRNAISSLQFPIEKATKKSMLETITTQQKIVDNSLLVPLELLIKSKLRKMVSSTETILKITEAVIKISAYIVPTAYKAK